MQFRGPNDLPQNGEIVRRILLVPGDMFGHQGRPRDDVIIGEQENAAAGNPYPTVACGCLPTILSGMVSNRKRRVPAEIGNRRCCSIRRAIVNHKDFQDLFQGSLTVVALERLEQDFLPVVSRDDDTHLGVQQAASPPPWAFLLPPTINR